jgi:putative acetyltransferase
MLPEARSSSVVLRLCQPTDADVRGLIAELDALNFRLYPPESCYLDPPEELERQRATMLAADIDGAIVGCGGVKYVRTWAELKRLYVRPEFRRHGIAKQLLAELEEVAVGAGRSLMRLETGIHQTEAIAFYEWCGYRRAERFYPYELDPLSVFMEKSIGDGSVI